MLNSDVETLFLASSTASASLKLHERMRERERQRAREITLSKCQNKAENSECCTHKAICKLHVLYLCRQAYMCMYLCGSFCNTPAFVKLTITRLCMGTVCICMHIWAELMQHLPCCVYVWYCVILQITKTCRWVKSH